MKTSDFIKFSAKKIKIDDEGKKKIIGLPVGWDKITKTSIQEGHKVLCVRTGKLNNITVIDFDSVKAYDKLILEMTGRLSSVADLSVRTANNIQI